MPCGKHLPLELVSALCNLCSRISFVLQKVHLGCSPMTISIRKNKISTTMKSFIRFSLLNAMVRRGNAKKEQAEGPVSSSATPALAVC